MRLQNRGKLQQTVTGDRSKVKDEERESERRQDGIET
jgi:hypothetical protein